jgi:penicillin-binding protein 3
MRLIRSYIILLAVVLLVFSGCSSQSAETRFQEYAEAWKKLDYSKMYDMLSTEARGKINREDFIKRNTDRYNAILENKNIDINVHKDKKIVKDENGQTMVPFSFKMNTKAGEVSFTHEAAMVEEKSEGRKDWYINWNQKMFHPKMADGDTIKPKEGERGLRGDIIDSNGEKLATDDKAVSIQINKIEFNKDDTAKLSSILDIKPEVITKYLEDKSSRQWFDLKKLSVQDYVNKKAGLNTIKKGVGANNTIVRTYPKGAAAMHFVGYINSDNEGVTGLEKLYNDKLKGKNGYKISIYDSGNKEKEIIAERKSSNGQNITVTIDSDLQKMLYDEIKNDVGAAVAINPKTGEVLSMVSTPSVDANEFILGMTQDRYKEIEEKKMLGSKFLYSYAPASTFKPITAAIGMKEGKIAPNEKIKITGDTWDNEGKWKTHPVKRVNAEQESLDLDKAMIYSDNIYFAKAAINIGRDAFMNGAKAFGIGEKFPIDFPGVQASQITKEGINSDRTLADSSYGQAQVQISPVELAYLYTAFLNAGSTLKPVLEMKEGQILPQIWKENVVSPEIANRVKESMIKVVNTPGAPRYVDARMKNRLIGGKTGTAETGAEGEKNNGWFVGFTADNSELLIVIMVENVDKDQQSKYVVPKVRRVMEQYLGTN